MNGLDKWKGGSDVPEKKSEEQRSSMRILGASKKGNKFSAHERRSSVRIRDEVGATYGSGQDLKTCCDRKWERTKYRSDKS